MNCMAFVLIFVMCKYLKTSVGKMLSHSYCVCMLFTHFKQMRDSKPAGS